MMQNMFHNHGFEYSVSDLAVVFEMIDFDGGGTIEVDEFLDGVGSFTANAADLPMHMLRLQCNVHKKGSHCDTHVIKHADDAERRVASSGPKIAARIEDMDVMMRTLSESLHAKLDRIMGNVT